MRRLSTRPIRIDRAQAKSLTHRALEQLYKHNSRVGWFLGKAFSRILAKTPDPHLPLSEIPGGRSFGFEIGVYTFKDVMGRDLALPVWMKAKPSITTHYIPSGQVKSDGDGYDPLLTPTLLEVFLNSSRTLTQIRENKDKLEKDLFSILIHELTHAHDRITEDANDDYFNDPLEVSAFMQQIAQEVLEANEREPRDVRQLLAESKIWGQVSPRLTSENRRRILKGIARVIEEGMDRP